MADSDGNDVPGQRPGKAGLQVPLTLTVDPVSLSRLVAVFRETLETTLSKALPGPPAVPEPRPVPQPVEVPPPPRSTGLDWKSSDRVKAADLRVALLTGKTPDDAGLLIDAKVFARLLSISPRTLARLEAEQAIPAPVHLARLKKWRLLEVLEWIEAGCLPQRDWSSRRQERPRKRGS
jgi:predicted DNA-binding transcriptional regulator AlpA